MEPPPLCLMCTWHLYTDNVLHCSCECGLCVCMYVLYIYIYGYPWNLDMFLVRTPSNIPDKVVYKLPLSLRWEEASLIKHFQLSQVCLRTCHLIKTLSVGYLHVHDGGVQLHMTTLMLNPLAVVVVYSVPWQYIHVFRVRISCFWLLEASMERKLLA